MASTSFNNIFLKTKIGQHDFAKKSCFQYCKIGRDFCPYYTNSIDKQIQVKRWTDYAQNKTSNDINNKSQDVTAYKAFKTDHKKQLQSINGDDEQAQYKQQLGACGVSCWGDCSGYQYDLMSYNVIGPGGPVQNIYDIYPYDIQHTTLKYSEWNTWIDKYQYDYRFGRVSDTNAECILFPNVDNPWMFTQYVFKGIGSNSKDKCQLDIPDEYVVQPPIYDPQTLLLINYDLKIDRPDSDYDKKYANQQKYQQCKDSTSKSKKVKEFRLVSRWDDLTNFSKSQVNYNQTLYKKYNNSYEAMTTDDVGIKLYRAKIPVQSVKWGEHGNVPAHAIDMTAPSDWMDPTQTVSQIKATYVAHVGSPFYANKKGVITWYIDENDATNVANKKSNTAYIEDVSFTELYDSSNRKRYQYDFTVGGGNPMDMPQEDTSNGLQNMTPTDKLMGVSGNNNYCHQGCSLCKGKESIANKKGLLTCAYLQSLSKDKDQQIEQMNNFFNTEYCTNYGKYGGSGDMCPHYVASSYPMIATYQTKITTSNQYSMANGYDNTRALISTGTAAGALMASENINNSVYQQINNIYSNLANKGDLTITYEIKYEVVTSSSDKAQLNKTDYNEYGKGVQIVPGTGRYALDSETDANPFQGGDTNVYNDISTLSFSRFFRSVMHCATQKNCNSVMGQLHNSGYVNGTKAGGDDDCLYYKSDGDGTIGCPYNGAPKRAIQFGQTASLIGTWLNSLANNFINLVNMYYFIDFYPNEWFDETKNLYRKVSVKEGEQEILKDADTDVTDFSYDENDNLQNYDIWWIFADWAIKLNRGIEEDKVDDKCTKAIVAVRVDYYNSSSSSSSSSEEQEKEWQQDGKNDEDKFGFLCSTIEKHVNCSKQYAGAVLLGNEGYAKGGSEGDDGGVQGQGTQGQTEQEDEIRFCSRGIPKGYMVIGMLRIKEKQSKFNIPEFYDEDGALILHFYKKITKVIDNQQKEEIVEVKNIYSQELPFYDKEGNQLSLFDKNQRAVDQLYKNVHSFEVLQKFFWYYPVNNNGDKLLYNEDFYNKRIDQAIKKQADITDIDFNYSDNSMMANLRQLVDKNSFWFCKYTGDFGIPQANCVIIDNEEKFIGGHHPEYKDYSKIGGQFMQEVVDNSEDRQGSGTGDYGNGVYTGIPNTINKKGYWIDQSGQYIIDERDIGTDVEIAGGYEPRQANSGQSPCISYKKSNTTVDGSTGKTVQAKVINGALFANDPYDLVYVQFRKRHRNPDNYSELTGGLPQIKNPEKQNQYYYAPCYIKNPNLLPTRRMAMHCPACDYYITYKYYGAEKCPWCGTELEKIKGDKGQSFQQYGDTENQDGANYGAIGHTWDQLMASHDDIKVIKKFFKLYGFGNVDVWAPPGTAVKTDAYFWRHQAFVSNALKKQIYHRLGDHGTTTYQFNKDTRISETTMGYPEGLGKFLKVPDKINKILTTITTKTTDKLGNETSTKKSSYSSYYNGFNPSTIIDTVERENGEKITTTTTTELVSLTTSKAEDTNYRYSKSFIDWTDGQDANNEGLYNPLMPRHMIPDLYDKGQDEQEDEGVIAPYTSSYNDALKLVSLQQIKVLRNAVQPMYAYTSDLISDDYPTTRASYSNRQEQTQPIIYDGRRATISPSVLACTDDGVDAYQDYYSGDDTYGIVRQYFPSGYTWWFSHKLLGGRYTDHTQGQYHMDSGSGIMTGGSGGVYTLGARTVSKCAISIYGLLPLDKQIVAAYLIISPNSTDASKNPVGLSWSGGPAMYHHYHAKLADHKPSATDRANYKTDAPAGSWQHLHGTAGYANKYFDQNGDEKTLTDSTRVTYQSRDIKYNDDSTYRLWGYDSHQLQDDRDIYYQNKFSDMMTSLPGLQDFAFYRQVGASKVDVTDKIKLDDATDITDTNDEASEKGNVIGRGYVAASFSSPIGFHLYNLSMTGKKDNARFQYVVVNDENDLVLKFPDSAVWKTITKDKIQQQIENGTYEVEFKASDGTLQNTVSYKFTQTDSNVYKELIPSVSQGITDYFDMSWTNTRGYVYGDYILDSNVSNDWNFPVIFQQDNNTTSIYSGGGNTSDQIGTVTRALDVTDIIKKLYNTRVARKFVCTAGAKLDELKEFKFYNILKKGTLSELDQDIKNQNKQCFDGSNGWYSLIDGFSYPKLSSVDFIPEIDSSGDKYELAESKVEFIVYTIGPFKFDENYIAYRVKIGDIDLGVQYLSLSQDQSGIEQEGEEGEGEGEEEGGEETEDLYPDGYDGLKNIVTTIFGSATDFKTKKISDQKILVTCSQDIEIFDLSNTTYANQSLSNIVVLPVGKYSKSQGRITNVTSYKYGYHPSNFLIGEDGTANGTFGWLFQSYQNTEQYFEVDLLRAPLCKWERDYRYEESSIDYSNAKCSNTSCSAHNMGCSVAANMSGKYFSSTSNICPICGSELDDDDATKKAGDGIKTYRYDNAFSPNPIISKIVIKTNTTYPSGYRVMIKSNGQSSWRTVIDAIYDKVNKKTTILYPSGKSDNTTEFQFSQNSVMGRFLRIQCQPYKDNYTHSYKITSISDYQVIVQDDFSDLKHFSFSGIEATINSDKYEIISAQLVGNQYNKLRITLNKVVPSSAKGSNIEFKSLIYLGGISEFEVYGYHYKTEQGQDVQSQQKVSADIDSGKMFLTMTDPQDEYQTSLSFSKTFYKLPDVPTQILSVSVGKSSSGGIVLTSATSSSNLLWTTQDVSVSLSDGSSKTIQKITGGQYYYEYTTGKFYLPTKNSSNKHWRNFQNELQGTNAEVTYLPDTLCIRYWSGNGRTITLQAVATGNGPSYMLQKNAIQTILNTDLPDNGKTCDIINVKGGKVSNQSIPWVCYNNKPSTLSVESQSKSYTSYNAVAGYTAGEFRKPTFIGDEIKNQLENDQAFIDLFGEYAEGCYGICSTQVTFIGAPNKILSGKIYVQAQATTKIENIDIDTNVQLTYEQRTGGIANGFLICSCSPSNAGNGRVTICYDIPKLLIYAEEKDHYSTSTSTST